MAITNVVDRGSTLWVYDERGQLLGQVPKGDMNAASYWVRRQGNRLRSRLTHLPARRHGNESRCCERLATGCDGRGAG